MIAFIFLEIKTSITQKLLNLKKNHIYHDKRDSIDTFHLFHDMYNSVCISYNIHNKQNSKKHTFMSSSCHLDRASIVEIGFECQIFLIGIFLTVAKFYNFGHIQGIIRVH